MWPSTLANWLNPEENRSIIPFMTGGSFAIWNKLGSYPPAAGIERELCQLPWYLGLKKMAPKSLRKKWLDLKGDEALRNFQKDLYIFQKEKVLTIINFLKLDALRKETSLSLWILLNNLQSTRQIPATKNYLVRMSIVLSLGKLDIVVNFVSY